MKTLVIHPVDYTTEDFNAVYANKDWTIMREMFYPKHKLIQAINDHDRIIMIGHGDALGLFNIKGHYVISSKHVYLLREKQCFCIWCYGNMFARKYELKGFATGMFVSDQMEANLFSVNCTNEELDSSNKDFSKLVNKYIDEDDFVQRMLADYSSESAVRQFNISEILELNRFINM